MGVRFFDTMTREMQDFKPIRGKRVHIYTCGQTVYDDLHMGNALTYCYWDILSRYLTYRGYDVFHVQNFTDVGHLTDDADAGEDKIEKRASESKMQPMQLVEKFIQEFFRDMDNLNVRRAAIYPRATGHIVEMIDMVKVLVEKGYGYVVNGSVYFDTDKFKDYGKMALLDRQDLKAGARICINNEKKNPLDFALWIKAEPKHIMKWNSPWGVGYPGWHLECSVMSMKYLGETLDIHGGGKDHIFPHHPNEIAQSEATTGKTFANIWLHTGFLNIRGEKMAKSKKNFIPAREVMEKFGANAARMFVASSHYRKDYDYNEASMHQAKINVDTLENSVESLVLHGAKACSKKGKSHISIEIFGFEKEFVSAMDDDMNSPKGLQSLLKIAGTVNKSLKDMGKDDKNYALFLLVELSSVFGVILGGKKSKVGNSVLDKVVSVLLEERESSRKSKDFKKSDEIRDKLLKAGVILEDLEGKTVWKIKD